MDWSPLFISIKTAIAGTGIAFALGVLAARVVSRLQGKLKLAIDGALTLPMVLPPTVVGFILLGLVGSTSPIGSALGTLGVRVVFSWGATVIAAAIVAFPLVYRTTLSSFEHLDPSITAAARTLGLSETRIFLTVTMPLSAPGVAAGAILAFARALGEFGATLMIAGNIPGKTQTIPIAIYFFAESGNMQKAALWVAILSAMSLTSIVAIGAISRRRP